MTIEQSTLDSFLPPAESLDTVLTPATEGDVAPDEPIQVAGVGSAVAKIAAKAAKTIPAVQKASELLTPLKDTEIKNIRKRGGTTGKTSEQVLDAVHKEVVGESVPKPSKAKGNQSQAQPDGAPKEIEIRAMSQQEVDGMVAARQQREAQGFTKEDSTPAGGSEFNLNVYDDITDADSLKATVDTVSSKVDYGKMSVDEIYRSALDHGIDKNYVSGLLGGDMTVKIGQGSNLAQEFAKVLTVFDDSAKKLDGMMSDLVGNRLDDTGKYLLRKQMAIHKVLADQVKGMQVDVARTMNVFKRTSKDFTERNADEVRKILDEMGGDDLLVHIAEDYLSTPSRAGRNKLVDVGLGKKFYDAIMYTYQSNLLTNPITHAVNITGSTALITSTVVESVGASGVGAVRRLMGLGSDDVVRIAEPFAMLHGMREGLADGWVLAKENLRNSSGRMKQDVRSNPLSAENFSDVRYTKFNGEVARTPDLRDTFIGKVIDGLGFIQSIPFKGLQFGDDLMSGTAARMKLHAEAYDLSIKVYDDLIAAGKDEATAMREASKVVDDFRAARPADIEADVDSFAKQVTLQKELNTTMPVLGAAYNGMRKFLDLPPIKLLMPFNTTLLNLIDQGTARTPGLNFISPQFWTDFGKGGKHRDLAISRVAIGGAAMYTVASLNEPGDGSDSWFSITGAGPRQPEERKALQRMNWQPYSLAVNLGKFANHFEADLSDVKAWINGDANPPENARRSVMALHKIRERSEYKIGEDYLYIPYGNLFDPLSMTWGMAADYRDVMNNLPYQMTRDGTSEIEQMTFAGMNAVGEYMVNMPMVSAMGDLVRTFRSNPEEGAESIERMFAEYGKKVGNFLITGVPGVGLFNSSLMAQVERITSPEKSNTMPSESMFSKGPGAYPAHAFYESWHRLQSRVPYASGALPQAYDDLGRPESVQRRGIRFVPSWGEVTPIDTMLASIKHGIQPPSDVWDGVRLSADQMNRYKELYGQKIRINGKTMEQSLLDLPTEYPRFYMEIGEAQKLVNSTVSMYRQKARQRMIGGATSFAGRTRFDPVDLSGYGVGGTRIEFPDLSRMVAENRNLINKEGK